MLYRVRQFYKALFAKMAPSDQAFYKQYLTEKEIMLFEQLRVYDQKHSVLVARHLARLNPQDAYMIKAGLLHDIGKQVYPLNPVEKGIMVILHKLSKGKIQGLKQLKMVKGYYEHPLLGYELLRKAGGYDKHLLMLVRDHHQNQVGDERLKLLQQADNLF